MYPFPIIFIPGGTAIFTNLDESGETFDPRQTVRITNLPAVWSYSPFSAVLKQLPLAWRGLRAVCFKPEVCMCR